MNRDALTLVLRAERLTAAGDLNDVEATLLEATDLEPRLVTANLQLAFMYEASGAHDKARARYERILAVQPNHAAALNNLAYSLAVHANQAARALPLAERALQLSNDPTIADTVGWIHHLLGNNPTASSLIERAVAALPDNLDVLVHAAAVRAALGDSARARAALEAALKVDPAASSRDDFKAVLGRLGAS
jgi:Tfp pilus assembly protein PilF